ncbi:uncharacterized protein MELLADRAFT_70582 [Melampsora larici-populina 98AG31]|uniref:Helicase C-terminal domain-containing protein n=1 Tax=Melampsora larici-populina (strain 98AG31 / pathotype 3-4-7) TaxID=747676 RepID=F4R673_MELLP|nr:uncharacterized protein MELLADRAFT_70582 [Melampsora larici-populina 98AG31]EGG12517.1 hypothetical protein MELLADRAFT_70582 [Melampsora larici-populina 98AG31]
MEVIVIGQTGLPELAQLFGRCGRGDKPGLALHFVEKTRKKGAKNVDDANNTKEMTEDELMNTFTFTPICLRVTLSLANM